MDRPIAEREPQPADAGPQELPGLSLEEIRSALEPLLRDAGQPPYRLNQVMEWVFRRSIPDLQSMSNVPRSLRDRLERGFILHPISVLEHRRSTDGTQKFLWKRRRGDPIESVLIPERERQTFCISTQAGCPVKCTFCATGFGGFTGQLTPGEIVDQVLSMRAQTGIPPTNIVFMGMGEPLLNFPAVLKALEILGRPEQFGLGARRITVSTVGIPKRIIELGERHPQVKLAISLHAARDELRDRIIPLNRQYPLAAVLEAVREHHRLTGKMATFEYLILPGVNDTPRDAREIGASLAGLPSRINLLGFNPFPGSIYRKPELRRLLSFREQLSGAFPGTVTIRRSRGEDIQGACGQLTLASGRTLPDSGSLLP